MKTSPVPWRWQTSPLAWLALRAIAFYQRHLSPRKGYCCALHAMGGGRSCSAYGYRAIARSGVFKGMTLLQGRLNACGNVQRQRRALDRQRGFCDAGCDIGGCDGCDVADLCSDGCDWPSDLGKKSRRANRAGNQDALMERVRRKMRDLQ